MKVVIPGGTGQVGTALGRALRGAARPQSARPWSSWPRCSEWPQWSRWRRAQRLPDRRPRPGCPRPRPPAIGVAAVELAVLGAPESPSSAQYYGYVTLIISVLTDEYVTLVSDRRITWSKDKKEDSDTKTFKLFGQFLMGFTGYSRINGIRMEQWVADVLRGVPTEEYFNVLAREM